MNISPKMKILLVLAGLLAAAGVFKARRRRRRAGGGRGPRFARFRAWGGRIRSRWANRKRFRFRRR